MTWTVVVYCEHGRARSAEVREGLIVTPETCCRTDPDRPSRLRIWWEARRMRGWLRGLRSPDDLA